MKIQRIAHIGVVVDDLAEAKSFFLDFGFTVQGEAEEQSELLDKVVGLKGAKSHIVFLQAPNNQLTLELTKFLYPADVSTAKETFMYSRGIKHIASGDKVDVRMYKVIYELIDDTREELSKLLPPEVKETELGRLVVKAVFKTTKNDVICGGEVTKGKLTVPALARVTRGDEVLAPEVEITNLKRGPADTKEVFEGEMCGLSFKTPSRVELQEGDRIELFTRETIARHL